MYDKDRTTFLCNNALPCQEVQEMIQPIGNNVIIVVTFVNWEKKDLWKKITEEIKCTFKATKMKTVFGSSVKSDSTNCLLRQMFIEA